MITCSIWREPTSTLWTFTDVFEVKMSFEGDLYVEFGKRDQDKALGTNNYTAHVSAMRVIAGGAF